MKPQQDLWHDTPEDALRSAVDALGGFKKVGSELWPALPIEQAARRLAQSLDADRAEKLSLAELCLVLRMARAAGVHVAASFLMADAGYGEPVPVDPLTEQQKLQREFLTGLASLQKLGKRLETLGQRS